MKTVKTYMVRKPSDLDEVKSTTRANSDRLETVAVVETINLTQAEHKRVCRNPLNDYGFLKGKGGFSDEHDYRQVVEIKNAKFRRKIRSSRCSVRSRWL